MEGLGAPCRRLLPRVSSEPPDEPGTSKTRPSSAGPPARWTLLPPASLAALPSPLWGLWAAVLVVSPSCPGPRSHLCVLVCAVREVWADPAACFCLSGTEVKDGGLRLGYERFHSPREAGHHPGSSSIGCPGPALCRVAPGQGNPGGGQPDLDSVPCSIWPWAGVLTVASQGLRRPCQLGRGGVGAAKLQRHLGPGGSREVRVLGSGWRRGSRWNPPAE